MIVGIGVDMVNIERFEGQIARSPRLMERLFTPHERELPLRSLAARYAAKEALIKALGGSEGVFWQEIEVPRLGERQAPSYVVDGETARTLAERGVTQTHLSLSHDGGLALAYVVLEGS
ncbi:holo-ACP synthase [Microbacterium amylolyticum]|uniref:Holo-[acyl-carrier-protein] synthase n=1 Tax=Microbacterium amylolyticum TaxID=936337 RepID=A0ABS4ZJC9_9MICO|nr:holo-ACP synthase [Microbacterium amylolyticum]MBP2437398.1 holo-[acyl-carrier protein] synthase [Microbacterium amylolyticum]